MQSRLFKPGELIYYADADMRGLLVEATEKAPQGAQFYAINPLLRNWEVQAEKVEGRKPITPRFSLNVAEYRNFIFESDRMVLPEQLAKWTEIATELPVAQLTFSGSKSYHAVVSVLDTLELEPGSALSTQVYKQAWTAIATYLGTKQMQIDHSTKDPARLTRLPGAFRGPVEQEAMPVQARYISGADVMGLIAQYAPHKAEYRTLVATVQSLTELEKYLAKEQFKGLARKIYLSQNWASSENMYPALFRLTLWAIDTLRPPHEAWLALCEKHIFPNAKAVGYTRNLELPIKNAFLYKGFRV